MDAKDNKKRKYVLFKADDGRPDHMKPCAFFASADGCKNGANCRFMHGTPKEVPAITPAPAAPASKVSKAAAKPEVESNDKKRRRGEDEQQRVVTIPASLNQPVQQQESDEIRKLREQVNLQKQMLEQQFELLNRKLESAAVPAKVQQKTPVKAPVEAPVSQSKKTPIRAPVSTAMETDDNSDGDDEKFLFGAVNHVLERGVTQTTPVQVALKSNASQRPTSAKKPQQQQQQQAKPVAQTASSSSRKVSTKAPESEEDSERDDSPDSEDEHDRPTPRKQASGKQAVSQAANGNDLFVDPATAAAKIKLQTPIVSKKKDIFATTTKPQSTATAAASPAPASAAVPLFDHTSLDFSALPYADLVAPTKAHKRYASDYNFTPDYTWVSAKPSVKGACKVVALDCEMCETTDPVTGVKENNSLVRFSVIDGTQPLRVLIDELVSPMNPITEARTRIHGISEEQLATVKYTLRHAQAALLQIIDANTIIVGHALHHDLKALRITHENVVDTSYLYAIPDSADPLTNGGSIPSLKMLTEQVLGSRLPGKHHDSVEDSRNALYAAAYYLDNDGVTPALVRAQAANGRRRDLAGAASAGGDAASSSSSGESSLLVHHIPSYCAEEHIERLFVSYASILPTKVSPIVRTVDPSEESVGRSLVYFATPKHAELAFECIVGPLKPDKQNRPQKRVYLKSGGYINVRK